MRIVIFCANGLGEFVLDSLDDSEVEVIAFADNNERLWGGYYAGVRVIPPDELKILEFDLIIIAYAEYAQEIKSQLEEFGIPKSKIIIFQENQCGITWYENRIAFMRRCAAVLEERNVGGNIAEVGVYQGEFSRLLNRYMPKRRLYLFDTFEGFRDKDLAGEESLSERQRESFKETSEEYVLSRMPYPWQCVIKKGWFPQSAVDVEDYFCFVSLDTDLYRPIKSGLEWFYPRMVKGGYIFVHDFGTQDWSGVKRAVYEFSEETGAAFFPLLDRAQSVVFVK